MLGGSCSSCCECGCKPTCTTGITPNIAITIGGIGSDLINGYYYITKISDSPVTWGGDFQVTCGSDQCATVSLRYYPCGTSARLTFAISTGKGSASVSYEINESGGVPYQERLCEYPYFFPQHRVTKDKFSMDYLAGAGLQCLYVDFGDGATFSVTPSRDCTKAGGQSHSGVFTPAADSLAKMGACCEGTTCSVKPQCLCQGTGKVFQGVGTVCTQNPCCSRCVSCLSPDCLPQYIVISYVATFSDRVGFGLPPTLIPSRTFSNTVTLTRTSMSDIAVCGMYTLQLSGTPAQSLDASVVYIEMRPKETAFLISFLRRAESTECQRDPCVGSFAQSGQGRFGNPTFCTLTGTSTGALSGGISDPAAVQYTGQAFFGSGYTSRNGFCFAGGSTDSSFCDSGSIDFSRLNDPCSVTSGTIIQRGQSFNTISVTIVDAY